jgi:hypothetical protein
MFHPRAPAMKPQDRPSISTVFHRHNNCLVYINCNDIIPRQGGPAYAKAIAKR